MLVLFVLLVEDWAIRGLAVLSVFLSLVCTLAALCRSCCCEGGKTVCHGVMAFLSGESLLKLSLNIYISFVLNKIMLCYHITLEYTENV